MAAPTLFTSRVLCCVCPHMCARVTRILACIAVYSTVLCFLLRVLAPRPCVSVSLCARRSRRTPTRAQSHRFGFQRCGRRTLMAGQRETFRCLHAGELLCANLCPVFFPYGENESQMLGDNSKTQWKVMQHSSDRLY